MIGFIISAHFFSFFCVGHTYRFFVCKLSPKIATFRGFINSFFRTAKKQSIYGKLPKKVSLDSLQVYKGLGPGEGAMILRPG